MPQRPPATIRLHTSDAAELLELLSFPSDWLESDADLLTNSFYRFVGNQAYDLTALQADLARFAFLLGRDDEQLLRPPHR